MPNNGYELTEKHFAQMDATVARLKRARVMDLARKMYEADRSKRQFDWEDLDPDWQEDFCRMAEVAIAELAND